METFKSKQLNEIRSRFQSDWEIPDFRIDFWNGKNCNYCIVIPVINEGDRISNFLKRLKQINVKSEADIVIVDGGSNDKSLGLAKLQSLGVCGLLTKISRGRLSSQLRVGYSFALIMGYDGIITIDGNNKDDPCAIFNFISLLQRGYDFVQASRFIHGGYHRNTPLIRYLAIRLIHAPLLSLFAGFHWTDTTQGFRAYSRRCLLDQRIKPFRSIFLNYELLSYFNYRVPIIGLKCIECPSTRLYPKGKTPTKINTFKANLMLIKTLIFTCLGKFNP